MTPSPLLRRLLVGVATITSIALATLGLGAVGAAAADPVVETSIGGFDAPGEGWNAVPNGTAGRWDLVGDAHSGAGAAKISADFPTPTGFVEFLRGGLPVVEPTGLRFWVKAENIRGFSLRMTDAQGQTHQRGVELGGPRDEWQLVDIDSLGGWGHWGGADDGVWRGAAQTVDIILDSWALDEGATTAALWVDDVVLLAPTPPLALTQTQLGNVFLPDEPTAFGITTTADTLQWSVTDDADAAVASGSQAIAAAESTLTVDGLGLGWYTISIRALRDGAEVGALTNTFARVPTPADAAASADSSFGISTHLPGYPLDASTLLTRAGVANVRDDITWAENEHAPGVYDFGNADRWALPAIDAGVRPLLIPAYGNPLYDGGGRPLSDAALEAYGDYVLAYIDHFGAANLPGVEIWNEWDLIGEGDKTAEGYVRLISHVAPRIRAAYPGLKIIGPADAFWASGFLEQTFQLGVLDYVDGVVLHPYNFPGEAEQLDTTLTTVQNLIARYNGGQQKPIWITEIGWPSGTDGQSVSAEDQASNIVRAQLIAASRGVEKTYNYVLVNEGVDPVGYYPNLGMMHNQADPLGYLTPKRPYVAFANLTAQLAGADFQGRESAGDGVWALRFDRAGTPVRAIWSVDPAVVDLAADAPVTVVDQYGRATELAPGANGRVTLATTDEVRYVIGSGAAVATASRLTLEPGFVGSTIDGTWAFDNSAGAAAVTATLRLPEGEFSQTVAAGAVGDTAVTLPARDAVGPVDVVGTVAIGAAEVGQLRASTTVTEPVTLRGDRALLDDGSQVLRLRVANRAPDAVGITSLDSVVLGVAGSSLAGAELAGGAERSVDVPIDPAASGTWSATVTLSRGNPVSASGTLGATAARESVPYRTLTVGGGLDDPGAERGLVFPDDGVVTMPPAYGGAADLGGSVWLDWDADALHLSARVTDDVHAQFATLGSTWGGDSIQLGISAGAPGDRTGTLFSEFTASLTSDGPEVWRGSSVLDQPGFVDGAEVDVVRDEAAKTTDYELSIPWARLDGIRPEDRLLSASIVLNDNDGSGREGWIEWGAGIATSKDPTLFRLLELAPAPASSDASLATLTVGGEPVDGFDPAVTAYAVELPYAASVAPSVAATAADPGATVTVTQSPGAEGTATVHVVAADGTTARDTTVAFTVAAHPPCTRTLDGTVRQSLLVDRGVTCLEQATVRGSIVVSGRGTLVADGGVVTGSITALAGTGQVLLDGTSVRGAVSLLASRGEVRIDGADLQRAVTLLGNRGGVTLAASRVGGTLTCLLNDPRPSNDSRPNQVAGLRLGQCGRGF